MDDFLATLRATSEHLDQAHILLQGLQLDERRAEIGPLAARLIEERDYFDQQVITILEILFEVSEALLPPQDATPKHENNNRNDALGQITTVTLDSRLPVRLGIAYGRRSIPTGTGVVYVGSNTIYTFSSFSKGNPATRLEFIFKLSDQLLKRIERLKGDLDITSLRATLQNIKNLLDT